MGTDIHLFAEVFDDEEGVWRFVPGPIVECDRCDGTGITQMPKWTPDQAWIDNYLGKPCSNCAQPYDRWADEPNTPNDAYVEPGKFRDHWYHDRYYLVFAYLAGVRNGVGFAGCDTGDPVVPIAEPRGLPDDISPEGLAWMDRHGGEHTGSWLGLEEIFRYPWGSKAVKRGVVDPFNFNLWDTEGQPREWSGDVSGGATKKISNDEMRAGIAAGLIPLGDGSWHSNTSSLFTTVQWEETAGDAVSEFLDRMKMLAMECGERRTRIVFDFDS